MSDPLEQLESLIHIYGVPTVIEQLREVVQVKASEARDDETRTALENVAQQLDGAATDAQEVEE